MNEQMIEWMDDTLFLIPNSKWLILALAIVAGFFAKKLLASLFKEIKTSSKIHAKAHGFVRYFLQTDLQDPLAWITVAFLWQAVLDGLSLPAGMDKYLRLVTHLILSFQLILLIYRGADALGNVMKDITSKTENTLDDQLAPLATKTLKVFVVVFGCLIVAQNLGVNVVSLLAGLGIGGLALALAAQDTAANLFGSITIIFDRPFQVGDWIKVADTEGLVEEIGFRSTRIRSFYGSLITIPNSVMAKEKIDNMGLRSNHRVRHTLGLTYDTTEEQMNQFMDQIRDFITKLPGVNKEQITVKFNGMGDFSLQILVNFFIQVEDVAKELEIQQTVLFEIMKIAKALKVDFAFPTATHLVKTLPSA